MPAQPEQLYLTAQQIRAVDRCAAEAFGIPSLVLMENAGRSVALRVLRDLRQPAAARVAVLCGPGNNGGDGLAAARHLHGADVPAIVILAADRARLRGDAATNLRIVEHLGLPLVDAATPAGVAEARDALAGATHIVDALLGIGASGPPREPAATLIVVANSAPGRRYAIDVPTGLDADTGQVSTPCFTADLTIALFARKRGFRSAGAAAVLGEVAVGSIGFPPHALPEGFLEALA